MFCTKEWGKDPCSGRKVGLTSHGTLYGSQVGFTELPPRPAHSQSQVAESQEPARSSGHWPCLQLEPAGAVQAWQGPAGGWQWAAHSHLDGT